MKESKEASLAKKAYDHFGMDYINTYPNDLENFQFLIDEFLTGIPTGGHILDIGCGNGAYLRYFLKHGFSALGIDISEAMLMEARRIVPSEHLLLMDMHNMEALPESTFDGIVSITSMLYLSKKHLPSVLSQVNRLLRPGGNFFLMMLEGEGEGLEKEEYFGKEAVAHTAYYCSSELEQILNSCGFSISKVCKTRLVVMARSELIFFASKAAMPL